MKISQASLRLPSWVKVDPLPPTPESELLPAGSPIPVSFHFSPIQSGQTDNPTPGLDWSDRGTADGGSPSDSQAISLTNY